MKRGDIIAKTEQTIKLEQEIWQATRKQGVFGCFEVTIGWFGEERVDYITYDTKGIWRCYEIKISKSDFHSKAHNTFLGHFNYYVMPQELYDEVQSEIPNHIGVYVNKRCIKKSKKQRLKVDEQVLKNSLIRSLYREAEKIYKDENPNIVESAQKAMNRYKKELEKCRSQYWEAIRQLQETKYQKGRL